MYHNLQLAGKSLRRAMGRGARMVPRTGTVGDAEEGAGILEEVGKVNKGKTIASSICLYVYA